MVANAHAETIRTVNRTIREFAANPRIPSSADWAFFCECGCFTLVSLSVGEFDAQVGVRAAGHAAV